MLQLRTVFYLLGILLCILASAMLIPLGMERFIYHTDGWEEFAFGAFITGSLGTLMVFTNTSQRQMLLKTREAFLLTGLCWTVSSFFCALPLYWSSLGLSFIDAWFESVSAITTTGATVIQHLDTAPKGILLWRAILQWLGGTGIILMALTVLPILRIGGMQLFRNDFSDRSEKILPRVSQITAHIASVYIVFTLLCGMSYFWAGMSSFDAVCHSMATVSTGGISTHDTSIGYYNNVMIELICSVFMIIGSLTFILYVRMWQGHWADLFKDRQTHVFLSILSIATLLMAMWHYMHHNVEILTSLRHSFFTVVSLISSSGFTTANYTAWGGFSTLLLLMLCIMGGCTGSTSGGIKVFRFQILAAEARSHLYKLRRPHGVYVPTYQGQSIPETVSTSVLTFVTIYFFSTFTLALCLCFFGLGAFEGLAAAIAAMSNIGAGVVDFMGPDSTYGIFPSPAKLLLMLGMILGRLELMTIFVLFMPSFWRN